MLTLFLFLYECDLIGYFKIMSVKTYRKTGHFSMILISRLLKEHLLHRTKELLMLYGMANLEPVFLEIMYPFCNKLPLELFVVRVSVSVV